METFIDNSNSSTMTLSVAVRTIRHDCIRVCITCISVNNHAVACSTRHGPQRIYTMSCAPVSSARARRLSCNSAREVTVVTVTGVRACSENNRCKAAGLRKNNDNNIIIVHRNTILSSLCLLYHLSVPISLHGAAAMRRT